MDMSVLRWPGLLLSTVLLRDWILLIASNDNLLKIWDIRHSFKWFFKYAIDQCEWVFYRYWLLSKFLLNFCFKLLYQVLKAALHMSAHIYLLHETIFPWSTKVDELWIVWLHLSCIYTNVYDLVHKRHIWAICLQ